MVWRRYYPKSRPREVEGGIKAHSKRGDFGENWWAKRWISVLESFRIDRRLARGKRYARKGQVLSIEVGEGIVRSEVQGSRATPYEVSIRVSRIPEDEWERLTEALSTRARYAARLLAGAMPEDIEECFEELDLSLFPRKRDDLRTECTCPDPSNPCKHIAAVFYLLGEQFDRDPFLIFRLRGMRREDLVASLGPSRPGGDGTDQSAPEELPAAPGAFWRDFDPGELDFAGPSHRSEPAALPNRLGKFPLWRSEIRFLKELRAIYLSAAERGLEVAAGTKRRQTP